MQQVKYQKQVCVACGNEENITPDAIGMPWCEEHGYRRDFINWGAAHEWREVHCGSYAVAPGQDMWMIAASLGNDDMVWALRSYQEMLSSDDSVDMEGVA